MTDIMVERQLWITCHHEAGHAVAAAFKGCTVFRIDIHDDGDGGSTRYHPTASAEDEAFITYAGPWAEARLQWSGASLDEDDDDGTSFPQAVMDAMSRGQDFEHGDLARYLDYWRLAPAIERARTEARWDVELEELFPIIKRQAFLLMEDCWQPISWADLSR